MNYSFLSILPLIGAVALAQESAVPNLKAGSEVKLSAVTSAQWIQGEPLKAFEPGKIYIFECWATWCGPCVAAIPHLNELHKKYAAQGLRVYGMNVWEDGADKVARFVKGKGDGMAYPVAYTGKNSAFETEWLKPAGVRGIPHAFVIKDGKILMMTHPMELSDVVVKALLSGDEAARNAAKRINAQQAVQEKADLILRQFEQAAGKGDTAVMEAKIAELKKVDENHFMLGSLQLNLTIARKDWAEAARLVASAGESESYNMAVIELARDAGIMGKATDFPADFMKALAGASARVVAKSKDSTPLDFLIVSAVQWKAGNKEAALASAQEAIKATSSAEGKRFPVKPLERFEVSLKAGQLPTFDEFSAWMKEASVMPASSTGPQKRGGS